MKSPSSSRAACSAESVSHSVLAGYAAGITGTVVGHPLDSAKVWLQTGATHRTLSASASLASPPPPHGAREMSTQTQALPRPTGWNLRTLRALYAGIQCPLVTVGAVQAINFGIYDSLRRILHHRDVPDASETDYLYHDSLTNVTLSSVAAGTVLAVFTSPFLVLKTKQQIMEWGMRQAIEDTLSAKHGVRPAFLNFYVGFGPHFVAETMGRGLYFCSYEAIKRAFLERKRQVHRNDAQLTVNLQERMMSAALAGVLCWTAIFPIDAVRSRMYAQSLIVDRLTTWELAKSMYRETQSLKPFFKGFHVTVLRAGPVAAAVLPVYDFTLEWLTTNGCQK